MAVVLTQEGVVPLVIAVGIAHGANLGTSVTSTIVAFAADTDRSVGSIFARARKALFAPRGQALGHVLGPDGVCDETTGCQYFVGASCR